VAIKVSRDGTTVTFVFEGTIDGKAALEMEKAVAANVTPDVRGVIADFAKVQLLTSAAIRQFLLLRKRMASNKGGLVLCAVDERVRTLLEIAGLWSQFTVADTRERALASLTAPAKPQEPPPAQPSRVGALLYSLLGAQAVPAAKPAGSGAEPSVDALVNYLEDVLGPRGGHPPKPTAGS
jgi:anti-anti-sigma factor